MDLSVSIGVHPWRTSVEHPECEKCESVGTDGKMPGGDKLQLAMELGDGCSNNMTCEMRKGSGDSHFSHLQRNSGQV